MKLTSFLIFILLNIGVAYSATQEATLIIKYPYHNTAMVFDEAVKISVNGAEAISLETALGAGDTKIVTMKVPAGILTLESAHWKREETNYINKIEVQAGKIYTVVVYMMVLQMWDTTYSAMQNMLTKNLEPEKDSYKNLTIKNQVISIK